MLASLKSFLQRLIKRYEGGYVWDKADPGGPTNYGVTWIALADHRKEKATSAAEWAPKVKAMSINEAIEIYENKYAPPVRYDKLPLGVDTTMLDYAVNSGPARPKKVACAIVGTKVYDDATIAKIKAMPSADFINTMNDERLRFMKALKGGSMWARYGKGWGSRVADLRAYSLALAAGKVSPMPPDLSSTPTPKAEVKKPSTTVSTSSSGLGGALATLAGWFADLPWLYIGGGVAAVVVVVIAIHVYRDIKAAKEDQVHL